MNKANNKETSVIKQLKDSSIKMEPSLSQNESVETARKKRKISEVISENNTCSKNKTKVVVCEKNSIPICDPTNSSDELPTVQKNDEDKTLLKPKLVVKEKKTIFLVEQDIFPMFISLCLQKDHSEDMKTVVNKLKRRYEQLDPSYANSETFANFLNEKRNDIMLSKNKLYIHIAEVMNEMKNNRKENSLTSLNGLECAVNTDELSVDKNSTNSLCSDMTSTNNTVAKDSEKKSVVDNKQEKHDGSQRKIRLILKAMRKCEKYIKRLEESEVDFDNENNSNYIKLEKFKHRMVELYNKYCEYVGESTDAGRQYLRPKHFNTTGIVFVDQAITSFINSKLSKRNKLKKIGAFTNALIFPDYRDILECVIKCNELHNLGLDNKKQQQIAKKAFTELGEYLQRCRRNDYWDTFSLSLENKEDDPALKDSQLAEKLRQNKQEGEKRLANVFQEYAKKQEEMKEQPYTTGTSTENEENEEDYTENEDEEIDNEIDNINEDGASVSATENKGSTDEDENGTDGSETPVSKMDINIKSSVNDVQSAIEIKEKHQTETNNKLKNVVNDLKLKGVDSDVNISKSEHTQLIKKNETTLLPDTVPRDLNTSPSVISLTTSENKILIEKTKEDESDIISEKLINEQPLEEEKPLLRVRSFAKLPGTWKDIQEKVGQVEKNNDIIDLTQESSKQNSTAHQQASIQSKNKVLPNVKDKRKMLVIPTGKNIIKVKNITNNYVRMGSKDSVDLSNTAKLQREIVTSSYQMVDNSGGSTTIRLPSNQHFDQKTNDNDQVKSSQTKKNNIIVQVPQSAQIVLLLAKQKEKSLQQSKTDVSMSQSK
ncbi:daxx-like protein isoform X2 [Megachile rotundata]|uniref:daxx-like protein isoform X2 n=1 Tax=Megachile rotundata TaxID=143995 RepID=UPI0006149E91|nr:PREDICTED: death domain-associated protein 6 isoform X2 [Megachile rotundata]